ncbi:hypothetical protein [Butyrivibrio sp. YAB3001]|uniref:hypothetical protein n=1 Tax=Butyrivibrio sp. YAB3001 TaxID=1520812 RepID=UPI0008F63F80|nr:hypothetical protein [Butyrivibrio sp. YAB3001]SFC75020.1 hypothetical protein SAMN02910398_03066 [Butyrivibrio sp. YAB3001]
MWNILDNEGKTLAIVIKHDFNQPGITFCTPDDYSQQMAYMHHPAGHVIKPHVHNEVKREVLFTKEVLVIKKGKLRCDFYSDDHEYIKSVILESGDVILLASGGHGFVCLEETEMYEIKQGPYAGEADKTRFDAIPDDRINIEVD